MKNRLGHVLSSSFNQNVINQRATSHERLPGLVDGLQSVKAGEKRRIAVPASRAYGAYDPTLVIELRRYDLAYSNSLMVGSEVLRRVGKTAEARLFRVIRLDDEVVVMDGNHPLAGHDLVFEVEIVSAREAKEDDFLDASPPASDQFIH